MRPAGRPRIGIFDSGVGGLTVAKAIREAVPGADLLYFGDTARVPYGAKSRDTIARYTGQILNFLVEKKVDLIVAACNTASALGLAPHRRRLRVPLVDVIGPACRTLTERMTRGSVAVLATRSTVRSGAYSRELRKLSRGLRVREIACPLFVPMVEEGLTRGPLVRRVVELYLGSAGRPQAVLLGCTHYPLLKAEIRARMGPRVLILDSATETARRVQDLFGEAAGKGSLTCFVSDEPGTFRKEAWRLLGLKVRSVSRVNIEAFPGTLR